MALEVLKMRIAESIRTTYALKFLYCKMSVDVSEADGKIAAPTSSLGYTLKYETIGGGERKPC
ncbi:hypothetical protein CAI16_14900 [Virgibacillus dokdonensis]|uniref:Uncharacterized protein n=1 Tax=Virgibacillus dokdonensis TaxID=302167 RepID=A0A3E0WN42_9BACI|nr:hypothetical protein CAI16_14900 [Virgibacillus dokdonensis]